MNKKCCLWLSCLCWLYSLLPIQAQVFEFGKVELTDLISKASPLDSSATAAILHDQGETQFVYQHYSGFKLETTRTVRIKIYQQSATRWADVTIPLFKKDKSNVEIVKDIEAFAYNIEDGVIQRDEMDKKTVFEEKDNEYWRNIKFAIPHVKEGTIIEYRYTKVSPFLFKPDDWFFQYDIPVMHSEYRLIVPAFYEYLMLYQGFKELKVNEARLHNKEHRLGGYMYKDAEYHWVLEDIPAYQNEPYITTRQDYIAKLIFQLSKTNFPGLQVKTFTSSWPVLVKELMELTYLGKDLRKKDTREMLKTLAIEQLASQEAQAASIYHYIQQHYVWNGGYGVIPSRTFSQLIDKKEGNCTDINLLLCNMLQEAGINASLVLLSTRGNGKINTKFPLLDQFNYSIVHAELGGKTILLDANDPELPFGMISEECLNGIGLIANPEEEKWINIIQSRAYFTDTYISLVYQHEKQQFVAQVKDTYRDYAAIRARKNYRNNQEELVRLTSAENIQFNHIDDPEKPFSVTYEAPYPAEELGDFIYLEPFLLEVEDNPFKSDERYFPVDYSFTRASRFMLTLTLPDGYEVDEWPQDLSLSLEDKAVSFTLQTQRNGQNLQLLSMMQIVRSSVPAVQYAELRQLYTDMISKQMEKIVLRRTKTE